MSKHHRFAVDRYIFICALSIFGLFLFAATGFTAGSSGIEVGLDSARALGKGNAVVADPQDASTLVYNPAGLAKLEGNQIAMGNTVLVPLIHYKSTNGSSEDEAINPADIPSFFASLNTPIDHLKVGGGLNAPFGLVTRYSSTENFKYTGFSNQIKGLYYTLGGAYEATPWLSIGGGGAFVDARVKQNSKLNATFINNANGLPGSFGDTNTELDVDGSGYGWNLGVLLTPCDQYAVGFYYRSSVHVPLRGEYNADNIQGAVMQSIFGGSSFKTSADTDITFPDSAVIGLMYKASDKLNLEVDLGWTGWGDFDHFDIAYGTSNAVLSGGNPSEHKFQDTFSVNVGADYKLTPNWDIMAGYAFYQQAALENDYSNVFPDGNRHNITVGFQYHIKQLSIAVAYAGQFVDGPSIHNNVGNINGVSINGDYSGFYHVVVTSLTYNFG